MSESSERVELRELGEFGLIDYLTGTFNIENESTMRGVGDDAAVIDNSGYETVVSTDMLVEGIHFDMVYTPLKHLGYKSVVVNLSDIYAMNAQPKQITVSLAISNRYSLAALTELYTGVRLACERYGVDLVGGDTTTSTSGLIISVTAIGQAKKSELVYRAGAKVGDKIFASGDFGAAYMGLQILEREKQVFLEAPTAQPDLAKHEVIVGSLLKPEARKDIIEYFKELGIQPTSMIDVSDGLSSELFHLAKNSEVGIKIYEENVPIAKETYDQALEFNIDPINCALNGGEDYELLFTLSPEDAAKITNIMMVTEIGEVMDESYGKKIVTKSKNEHELQAQGWNPIVDMD